MGIHELFLFFHLFLQFRQFAIFQFRSFAQIVFPFGLFHFILGGIDFFLQCLGAGDSGLFFFPLFFQGVFFFFQFILLGGDFFQTFFRSVIRFLTQ